MFFSINFSFVAAFHSLDSVLGLGFAGHEESNHTKWCLSSQTTNKIKRKLVENIWLPDKVTSLKRVSPAAMPATAIRATLVPSPSPLLSSARVRSKEWRYTARVNFHSFTHNLCYTYVASSPPRTANSMGLLAFGQAQREAAPQPWADTGHCENATLPAAEHGARSPTIVEPPPFCKILSRKIPDTHQRA